MTITRISEESGYFTVDGGVVVNSDSSPFSNGESVIVTFSRTADKGDSGSSGTSGTSGTVVEQVG